MVGPRGAWWLLALWLWSWSTAVHAEPKSFAWLSTKTDPPELAVAFREAALAHTRGLSIEVMNPSTQRSDLAGAVAAARELSELFEVEGVFFVLTQGDEFAVYLYQRNGPRLWVQPLDVRAESRQSALEAVGVVVADASRSILAGSAVGMETTKIPPPPRPEPEPEEKPPAESVEATKRRDRQRAQAQRQQRRERRAIARRRWHRYEAAFTTLAAGYAGEYLSADTPWQSGGRVALAITLPIGVAMDLGYRILPVVTTRSGPHELELRRNPIEFGLGYRVPLPRSLFVAPGLGLTLDPIGRRATSDDPAVDADPASSALAVAVAGRVTAGWTFARRFGLWLAVGAEVWVSRTQFAIAVPEVEVLERPGVVRPTVSAGLSVSFGAPTRRVD